MINRVLHTLTSRCQTPSFKHPGRISASWKDWFFKNSKTKPTSSSTTRESSVLYTAYLGKQLLSLPYVSSPYLSSASVTNSFPVTWWPDMMPHSVPWKPWEKGGDRDRVGARSASQRNDFTSPAGETEAWRAWSLSPAETPAELRDQGSQLREIGTRRQKVSSIFNYKWRTFFMPSLLVIPQAAHHS